MFVAVDWGTTNRRSYLVENGAVVRTEHDAAGILAVPAGEFPSQVAALRHQFGGRPLLLAGMVGSNRGWIDAGYVACPARLDALAAAAVRPEDATWIVPGVSTIERGRGDVMRGEEVQLLGAVAAGLAPADALLCQPGTHCKWARLAGGTLTGFTTAMTGEMFAVLRDHALIGSLMRDVAAPGAAFTDGVARSGEGDWLAALFGVRAASLLGLRADSDASAYVSGLLIGTDVRAQVSAGDDVHVLADAALGTLYAAAIRQVGGTAVPVDSHAAFVAGMTRLWELLP